MLAVCVGVACFCFLLSKRENRSLRSLRGHSMPKNSHSRGQTIPLAMQVKRTWDTCEGERKKQQQQQEWGRGGEGAGKGQGRNGLQAVPSHPLPPCPHASPPLLPLGYKETETTATQASVWVETVTGFFFFFLI